MSAKAMFTKSFVSCAVLLAGCASSAESKSYEQRLAEMMRPFQELERQKADLWRLGHEPQVFDFDGHGRVTVKRWELSGWPGEVYVNARITYENTTDHAVAEAFVWLDVLDSNEQVAGSTAVRLVSPMGYAFWPGHTYTTELRAATNGAHLDPAGWSWSVACNTLTETEPGTPPVIIDPDSPPPRGWWLMDGSSANSPRAHTHFYGPTLRPRHVPGEDR